MIYLVKKNGAVIAYASLDAMKRIEGVNAPDMTVSEAEWEQAGGIARIIGGDIVLGKTEAEITAEENEKEIALIDKQLEAINQKQIRPAAEIISKSKANAPDAVAKLNELEAEAATLRTRRGELVQDVA